MKKAATYSLTVIVILLGVTACIWFGFILAGRSKTIPVEPEEVARTEVQSVTKYPTKSPVLGKEIKGLPDYCADKLISVSGCDGQTEITTGQGNAYRLIEIGDQCWFADNSKEIPTTDKGWYGYYDNAEDELSPGEGLLYTWDAAMNGEREERAQGVCPDGWHVPSECETVVSYSELGINLWNLMLVNLKPIYVGVTPVKKAAGEKVSRKDSFHLRNELYSRIVSNQTIGRKGQIERYLDEFDESVTAAITELTNAATGSLQCIRD